MRKTQGRQSLLENAAKAFNQADSAKTLTALRRAARVAQECDLRLGKKFIAFIEATTGYGRATIMDPSSHSSRGERGRLADAFAELKNQLPTPDSTQSSRPERCAQAEAEPRLQARRRTARAHRHS